MIRWEIGVGKVEKILKGSLASIPSTSLSVKIQLWAGKFSLNVLKSLLTTPTNVLPYYLKLTFPPMIWIFTGRDEIESRLSS